MRAREWGKWAAFAVSIGRVEAQGVAVSATAAWSSQIVAFWGAVGIGVRSSNGLQSSNAVTSGAAYIAAAYRANAAADALRHGGWYLFAPGFNGGKTRLDVVLLCWTTPCQLWCLCAKLAMLVEAVGRQRWLVLIVGRKLRSDVTTASNAYWTQSPRCPEFSVTRFVDTSSVYVAFSQEHLQALEEYSNDPLRERVQLDMVASMICGWCDVRATRTATRNEAPWEVQEATTIGRHITSYQIEGVLSPYIGIRKLVAEFGRSRQCIVISAIWMYVIVHSTVCIAVGLMGAASGRGLAVWIFTSRLVLSKLGADSIAGDDVLLSLIGFDRMLYNYTSEVGNVIGIASDSSIHVNLHEPLRLLLGLGVNLLEMILVVGGWFYGSLKVEKLAPKGVVGHGMLWLATLVSIGLSIRALAGVYERISARLIGVFEEPLYVHQVVAHDCRIDTSKLQPGYLQLVSDMLVEVEDDTLSIVASLSLLRQPSFCEKLERHVALDILKYITTGDVLVQEGDNKNKVSTSNVYPWKQVSICVAITMVCSSFGPVYAYMHMPRWSKLVAETLLALNATWFATLARTSKLGHNQSTQICHMVATMVASAVWYVGVKDVG